ncbi:MAG: hypothetical protein JWP15_432 [Alphaproteobacteria bacterium]|nr:hypothetical protein [Alphaproteobacteria bacterium]
MKLENQTDHVAILALMIAGVLMKRLDELGEIDDATAKQLHHLVGGVRRHATHFALDDLNVLFDNIDRSLSQRARN